jgi:hypothetical protein
MSQPTAPRPIVVPPRPAQLLLGERAIPVPVEPLCREAPQRRNAELRQEGPDCLLLTPVRSAGWNGWVALGIVELLPVVLTGFLGFITFDLLRRGSWVGAIFLGMTLPVVWFLGFIAWAVLRTAGPPRFRFDRHAGQLAIDRRPGPGRDYRTEAVHPLGTIVGVQLLYGGYHHHSHTSTEGPNVEERYHAFEMNLLLSEPEGWRLNLTAHGDWQWMRQAGPQLADFLGVPLIDQLSPGS